MTTMTTEKDTSATRSAIIKQIKSYSLDDHFEVKDAPRANWKNNSNTIVLGLKPRMELAFYHGFYLAKLAYDHQTTLSVSERMIDYVQYIKIEFKCDYLNSHHREDTEPKVNDFDRSDESREDQ